MTIRSHAICAALRAASPFLLVVSAFGGTSAQAQTQLRAENHVMSYRLQGTWQSDHYEFVFQPRAVGITGKATAPGLLFRKVHRNNQKELQRGPLTPVHDKGLLNGLVVTTGATYQDSLSAWVDDKGRLWLHYAYMNPFNGLDGKFLTRAPVTIDESKARRWSGAWQTNRGILQVSAEGSNFVAWIHRDGGKRERVAFSADRDQATGAWDTEYNDAGVSQNKPVRWGDLNLALSADGQSFTGWYSVQKPTMGFERREWTGQRVQPTRPASESPASQQPAPQPPAPQQPAPPEPAPQPPAPQQPQRPAPQPPAPPPQLPAPRPQPAPPPPAGPVAEAPAPDFQPLGKWDVRLDRVENPRDDRLTHVYLTLRNAGTQTLLQTQDVWVYLEDSSGVEQRSGQGLKAQPGRPELFGSPQPVVRPGREIRTKFIFDRHQSASPTRITVEEGGKEAVYEF